MSQPVVLRDLTELAQYRGEFASDPEPTITTKVAMPPPTLDDQPDQLVQAILRSARELQRLSEQDGAADEDLQEAVDLDVVESVVQDADDEAAEHGTGDGAAPTGE